jgi:uncharacterized protein (TIGR03067 family)
MRWIDLAGFHRMPVGEAAGYHVMPGGPRFLFWSSLAMNPKCLLALGVLFLALPAVRSEDNKLDPAKLIGTWTYVSGEKNGEKVPEANLKAGSVIIAKDKITLKGEMGDFILKYKLNPAKSPCTIAMEITEGPAGQGSMADGIIDVQGDHLKICYPAMGGATPTEFAAKKDSGLHYFVLKRKK